MTNSKTIILGIVNLAIAALAVFLPVAGYAESGAALTDLMQRPEYIVGMGSLVAIFMRMGIKKAERAALE